MFKFLNRRQISDFNPELSRNELIKRSRILVIDDERPQIIDDLIRDGFSVEHDKTGESTMKIEQNLYDLILLDYQGVGSRFGKDQGLSLLKHIKRVNPAPFILAYTSKPVSPEQSDFYRLTDGTLFKDAGIQESLYKIEESLRKALSIDRLWLAIMEVATRDGANRKELEKTMLRCLERKHFEPIYEKLGKLVAGNLKESLVGYLLSKLIGLAAIA
jgi:CheY-like chemotaxis protein